MSVKVMGFVWDHYPAGGSEKLVALALADEADHEGNNIYPGVERLARRCHMSGRGVQKILRRIETREIGGIRWFELLGDGRGGRKQTRRYRCPIEALRRAVYAEETANAVHAFLPGETTNAVQGYASESTNGVHCLNPEQGSPFSEKGRTNGSKRVNASSPDPLGPVKPPPTRASAPAHADAPAGGPAREAGQASSPLAFGEVVQILQAHGTPHWYCTGQFDRDAILGWAEAGVTGADLSAALGRALQRNRGGAIGPRYLDPFVKQVVHERLNPASQGGNHDGKNSGRRRSQSATDRSREGAERYLRQRYGTSA